MKGEKMGESFYWQHLGFSAEAQGEARLGGAQGEAQGGARGGAQGGAQGAGRDWAAGVKI